MILKSKRTIKKTEMTPKRAAKSLYPLMYSSSSVPKPSGEVGDAAIPAKVGAVLEAADPKSFSGTSSCVCTNFLRSGPSFFGTLMIVSAAPSAWRCCAFIEVGDGDDRPSPDFNCDSGTIVIFVRCDESLFFELQIGV
jgi:hypothetical protein